MADQTRFALKGIDWGAMRRAYVERPARPTYEEMASEFGCATGSIGRLSSEEGWPALRAQHLEAQCRAADASAIILEACKIDRTIVQRGCSVALLIFEKLAVCVEAVKAEQAAGTQASALNTASFALKNVLDGLRAAGVIGVSRTLDAAGKMENGRWNGEMLTQINVNLTGLQASLATAQAQAPSAATAAEPVNVNAITPGAEPSPAA